MSKLKWDEPGERLYETGVEKGVLYPFANGAYGVGVEWNGLTAVNESPSGGEPTALYADDMKYVELTSKEEFGATIEAYTYPDEFAVCDGSASVKKGVIIGQQKRSMFGMSYVTKIGNDEDESDHGYKIHLIYGAKARPSEKSYETINDSPDAITFSWEISTTPVKVKIGETEYKPTAHLIIDSTKVNPTELEAFEKVLYGTDAGPSGTPAATDPTLPLPAVVAGMFTDPVTSDNVTDEPVVG